MLDGVENAAAVDDDDDETFGVLGIIWGAMVRRGFCGGHL